LAVFGCHDSTLAKKKTGKAYLEIKRWLPAAAGTDLESDEIPF
jgi:hypothetical protein